MSRFLRHAKFYWNSKTVYNEHSPLVYNFYTAVQKKNVDKLLVEDIENLRADLYRDHSSFQFSEHGAGSDLLSQTRRLSQVARTVLCSKREAESIHNIVCWVKPKTCLELGTSLGLTSAYISRALNQGTLWTIEGDHFSSCRAKQHLTQLKTHNVKVVHGTFSDQLPIILNQVKSLDFVFMDGHHKRKPTLNYYSLIEPKLSEGSVVIIDDVLWSDDMLAAWENLKKNDSVSYSILTKDFGILFCKYQTQDKLHFELVRPWSKPWTMIKMI